MNFVVSNDHTTHHTGNLLSFVVRMLPASRPARIQRGAEVKTVSEMGIPEFALVD